MGVIPVKSSSKNRNCLPITLEWNGASRNTSALLDTGAEESFVDAGADRRWGIPLQRIELPREANSLNGQK